MRFLSSWLPVALWIAIILSAANDQFATQETAGWLERLLGDSMHLAANWMLRKAGHLVSYGILALLTWRAGRSVAVALLLSLAVAVTDETMQAMTISREGSVYDVLLDLCGALLALLLLPSVRQRMRARKGE